MNISGQEPCVSGPSPCYMFLRGALVIFGKYIQGASQIFTMPSRCRVRMNFPEFTQYRLGKEKKSHRKCMKSVSRPSIPEGMYRTSITLKFCSGFCCEFSFFSAHSYLCSTVSLWVGVQNSSVDSFRFQSRKNYSPMGVHNAQLSPACTPITPYLA